MQSRPLKLYTIFPNAKDATSFYRGVGPLAQMDNITMHTAPETTWAALALTDAMFMQRPYTPGNMDAMRMAKRMRRKVWVDYDDDLYSVPLSNRTYDLYRHEGVQNAVTDMLAKADLVTVSTEALADKFRAMIESLKGKVNDPDMVLDPTKVHLVYNAYDERLFQPLTGDWRMKRHQRKLLTWRGSCTHDDDLWAFAPQIRKSVSTHMDWTYTFVGDPFWLMIDELRRIPNMRDTNVITVGSMDPIEYLSFMRESTPQIVMVPLRDCPFNRAKSNIAWFEATHCGAVTLAPDWPEWRHPGVINYFGQDEFSQKLEALLRGEIDWLGEWKKSAAYIKEHLTLERQNRIRSDLVEKYLRNW